MKGGDKAPTGTLRMILSAIKNRDIERAPRRRPTRTIADWSSEVLAEDDQAAPRIGRAVPEGQPRGTGRGREEAEIAVIERFLPQPDERGAEAAPPIAGDHRRNRRCAMKDMGRSWPQ